MIQRRISVAEFLAPLPLFCELDSDSMARLASAATARAAPKGSVIYNRGDACTGLYAIVYGQVKLSLQTRRGDEKVVQLADRGETFGEPAIFLGQPYLYTAEAAADTKLVHVTKESVLSEVSRNNVFARRMLEAMSLRLTHLLQHIEGFMLRTGTQRVIDYLLNRLPDGCTGVVEVSLPATKGIIASNLNLTHEHFSRILHELSAGGLIEVRGPLVCILDAAELRARSG